MWVKLIAKAPDKVSIHPEGIWNYSLNKKKSLNCQPLLVQPANSCFSEFFLIKITEWQLAMDRVCSLAAPSIISLQDVAAGMFPLSHFFCY